MRLGLQCAVILAVLADPVLGGDKLNGAEITNLLAGKVLMYGDNTTQLFTADGKTIMGGNMSRIGHWKVEGNRYCSAWPPSEHWSCYDLTYEATNEGKFFSFVSDDGSVGVGVEVILESKGDLLY